METKSKYFDGHGRASQSEENECMWAHDKDGVTLNLFWTAKSSEICGYKLDEFL